MRSLRAILVFGLALVAGAPAWAGSVPSRQDLTGRPRVVDGDTLAFGSQRVRLFGIDAPESTQMCGQGSRSWRCGQASKDLLDREIGQTPVHCQVKDTDPYGRLVAVCQTASGEDLNAFMVSQGLAIAYTAYSDAYLPHQRRAQALGYGIWSGSFQNPADYRHGQTLSSREEPIRSVRSRLDDETDTLSEAPDRWADREAQDEPVAEQRPTFRGMACAVLHKGC